MGRSSSCYNELGLYCTSTQQEYFRNVNPCSCSRTRQSTKMTFFKRCLIVFFLQIGCLALDHSTTELAYEEDEIRLIVGHHYPAEPVNAGDSSNDGESDNTKGNAIISFHPKFFDFKESPVGMPRLGVVRVDNRLKDENLKLISISGNTVNFHSSFFADKVISPGNTTTFDVVFLSREEGLFESILYIHTSKGLYKYHVRGVGLPNPYRLRPLVGARIPVNASYEPLITLHNPHETRIMVVEMLSSGTDFSLKLPDEVDEQEGDTVWAIEPFQTKPVMQGSFQGKTEGNHTGFIRIKVNHTDVSGEYLMVPVEVQVSSSPGIYSPQESLDFGLLVRSDKPKTLSLSLINAQTSLVNVQSVSVKGDPNSALRIEFRPVVIEPDISASTVVALVTFDPSQVSNIEQSNGFIEIRSDCGKSISIPFQATVLQGELEYNASSLGFFIKAENIPPRNFSVRNNFSSAVAIYQVSVNHPDIVQIDHLNQSHVITPGEQKTIFTLKVNKKAELCDSKASVQLTVKSNVTSLKLPITCYDGKLHLHSAEQSQVDFGRIELYSTHTEYFSVENRNPIEIRLKSWGSNSSWSQVELVGMQKGVKEDLAKIRDFDSLKKSLFLQPGHMAVFSIDIRRPSVEGMFYGESYVTTDHNQTLRVPFRFAVSKGSVLSDTIFFDKAFPGKISFEKLHVVSTFNDTTNLLGVRADQPCLWFSSSTLQEYPEVSPHRKSFVGKVYFDPQKFCKQECYSGFVLNSKLGQEWIEGSKLSWNTGKIDFRILETLRNHFQNVKDCTVSNMSLWIDTSDLTGFKVKAQVRYIWPRLFSSKIVTFPLTALGNDSVMEIPIYNPSNLPIVVQAALAKEYGSFWENFIDGNLVGGNTTEGGLAFTLSSVSSISSHSNNSVIFGEVQQQIVEEMLGLKEIPGVTFVLPPGAKFLLNAKFKPISKDMASALLLLRNNLTGIETIWLRGRAGTGQLTVGSLTPGSSLIFQLTEKLLQGCQTEPASKYVPPQLTVRRSFLARNVGEIPLDIESLQVYPPQGSLWSVTVGSSAAPVDACEGYGFRILNCHPFTLQPNQTHSIDIAFTPDFTLSRVVRSLRLTDSTGCHFNYSLVALIPSGMLSICASIIARPTWEPYFKYLLAIGAIVCIVAAAVMSYFEAGSVVSSTVVATIRVTPKEHGPDNNKEEMKEKTCKLDLKSVYDKVENRFKRHQSENQKAQNCVGSAQSANKSQGNAVSVSNSNVRNRKTKKASNEVSFSQNNLNKLSDKGNHLSRSGSHLSSADDISDSTAPTNFYSNMNITNSTGSKKDKEKENAPIPAGNVGKKKKNSVGSNQSAQNQHQVQTSKQKKLQSKNDNFNSGSFSDKNKNKTEEETSSTTTESSNPDDFITPYNEKERKLSGKTLNDPKNAKTGKKDKQDRSKTVGSSESVSGSMECLESKSPDEAKKKSTGKKRDQSGSNNNTVNSLSGNVSPKQDISLWDTPRPPSGDGLSELAAQTEAFVNQRPNRRNNSGGDQSSLVVGGSMTNINSGSMMSNMLGSHSHQTINSHQQMNNTHMQQQPNRMVKKPGVIGQPRLGQAPSNHLQQSSSIPHPLSPTATSFPSYSSGMNQYVPSSSNSGMNVLVSGSNIGNRQTSPIGRPMSNSNNSGSIWGSDMLSDNGCDIWGRRTLESAANSSPFLAGRSENVYSRPSNLGFGTGGNYHSVPNGYPAGSSSSAGGMINNSTDARYGSRTSPTSKTPLQASGLMNGNAGSGLPSNGTDSSYLFNSGGIANEILSNLWQINSGSYGDSPQQYRSQSGFQSSQQQQSQFGLNQSGAGTVGQHGYLQRMRSDPTVRTQQRPAGKNWPPPMYGELSGQHRSGNQNAPIHSIGAQGNSVSTEGNGLWLPPTVTSAPTSMTGGGNPSVDSAFAEWNTIGKSGTRLSETDAEIWEAGPPTSVTKWPTSYGSTPLPNNFTDSMAVGSGSRSNIQPRQEDPGTGVNPLGDLGLRGGMTSEMTQNLREVEAGLGFNPFTSDIWNHEGRPSWNNNSFRYSSNE